MNFARPHAITYSYNIEGKITKLFSLDYSWNDHNIYGRKSRARWWDVNCKRYPKFENPISAHFQSYLLFLYIYIYAY